MKRPAMLTRGQLARVIALALEIPLNEAESVVQALFASMTCALQRGEEIEIRGFGSWRIRTRLPRTSRNPRTGMPVQVPAKKIVAFRPARELFSGQLDREPIPIDGKPSIAADMHPLNVQTIVSPPRFPGRLDDDGDHYKKKACCGPFVAQNARLHSLAIQIAALRGGGADALTIELALKQKRKVEGWLARHSHEPRGEVPSVISAKD